MLRVLILTIANAAFAYACMVIVLADVWLLPRFGFIFNLIVWEAGPIPLLLVSSYSAAKLRQLRRMDDLRQREERDPGTALARGEHILQEGAPRKSSVEHLASFLVWLSLVTFPFWLHWQMPVLWGGAALAVWALRRSIL